MDGLGRYLSVGIGSALGGMSRYWLSGLVAQRFGETFPWGTMFVNVSGSFVIGLLVGATSPDGRFLISPTWRQFLMIGICGGYTTFSSFSLETMTLARDGELRQAGLNILLSLVMCLLAVWLGNSLAMTLNRARGG